MREPEKGTRRRCGRPERYAARGRETGPRPRGETARPAPEIDQPLPRAISTFAIVPVDLAEEVLLPCEPEHCEQAAQQRVGSVLEHVVGIAAGHDVPWEIVGGAAASARSLVVENGAARLVHDIVASARDAEAHVGLVEVVVERLVEAADLHQHLAAERAVAACDASHPAP